ncbi:MAG: hypothetical protein AAFN74_22930 [Myxococcota bacterium]
MSIDKSLAKAQTLIPDCIASGWVDMSTGLLLGIKSVDSHPGEVLDLVAAATADLFQGRNVSAIEMKFRQSRGNPENGEHYFQEIIVFSRNLLHIFLRGKRRGTNAAVFVCRGGVNIGMALVQSRLALSEIEEFAG